MADSDIIITPSSGDTSADNLLEMADKVSNVLIGQNASAVLKPSKTDIINGLNDAYRELCTKYNWTWLYYTGTISTPTTTVNFPSNVQKIIKIYSNDDVLLEWPQDNYHYGTTTENDVPYGRFVITGWTDAGEPMVLMRWGTLPATASYVAKLRPVVMNLDIDFPLVPTEFRWILREMCQIKFCEQGKGLQDVNYIQGLYARVKQGIDEMKKYYLPSMQYKEMQPKLQSFNMGSFRNRRRR